MIRLIAVVFVTGCAMIRPGDQPIPPEEAWVAVFTHVQAQVGDGQVQISEDSRGASAAMARAASRFGFGFGPDSAAMHCSTVACRGLGDFRHLVHVKKYEMHSTEFAVVVVRIFEFTGGRGGALDEVVDEVIVRRDFPPHQSWQIVRARRMSET